MTVTWEELNSPRVEDKLKQLEAVSRAREQYRSAPPPEPLLKHKRKTSIWYNTVVYMGVFGLLGSLLGWGIGAVIHARPNPQVEAAELLNEQRFVQTRQLMGRIDAAQADIAMTEIRHMGRDNPYFLVEQDKSLTPAQKDEKLQTLLERDKWKRFITDLLFYGVCGMMIAVCLAIAEPVVERNFARAISYGSLAALLGICGGFVVAIFIEDLYKWIAGVEQLQQWGDKRFILARAACWAMLGLFLSAAPGLVLGNSKKLLIGIVGGLIGGIVGGVLFDPIEKSTSEMIGRLAGMVAVGVVAGVATGLIETIAKSGSFKVAVGVISGKQFVLYRNPTYIGSAPQCQIYLFKDPEVGRRHAAVHIVPGGFELENLPLGKATFVNGKSISRARLRNGDRVQVGATTFVFNEKPREF